MTRFLQVLSFTKIEKHIDLTIEQLSDYKGELFFLCDTNFKKIGYNNINKMT